MYHDLYGNVRNSDIPKFHILYDHGRRYETHFGKMAGIRITLNYGIPFDMNLNYKESLDLGI